MILPQVLKASSAVDCESVRPRLQILRNPTRRRRRVLRQKAPDEHANRVLGARLPAGERLTLGRPAASGDQILHGSGAGARRGRRHDVANLRAQP